MSPLVCALALVHDEGPKLLADSRSRYSVVAGGQTYPIDWDTYLFERLSAPTLDTKSRNDLQWVDQTVGLKPSIIDFEPTSRTTALVVIALSSNGEGAIEEDLALWTRDPEPKLKFLHAIGVLPFGHPKTAPSPRLFRSNGRLMLRMKNEARRLDSKGSIVAYIPAPYLHNVFGKNASGKFVCGMDGPHYGMCWIDPNTLKGKKFEINLYGGRPEILGFYRDGKNFVIDVRLWIGDRAGDEKTYTFNVDTGK